MERPLWIKVSGQPSKADQDDLGRTCLLYFLEFVFREVLMGVYRKG